MYKNKNENNVFFSQFVATVPTKITFYIRQNNCLFDGLSGALFKVTVNCLDLYYSTIK
jgi:hypothetical protein